MYIKHTFYGNSYCVPSFQTEGNSDASSAQACKKAIVFSVWTNVALDILQPKQHRCRAMKINIDFRIPTVAKRSQILHSCIPAPPDQLYWLVCNFNTADIEPMTICRSKLILVLIFLAKSNSKIKAYTGFNIFCQIEL